MQLKPRAWYLISLLLFVAAICVWRYGNKYAAEHRVVEKPAAAVQTNALKSLHPPMIKAAATNAVVKAKSYRISNTTQTIGQLLHNNHAIILRNAWIDTEVPVRLNIPEQLRAKGAPGSYLVQADRPLDNDFYSELGKSGAKYVSYVPNDTALVTATPEEATNLAANADIIAVLPYEPYYKLDGTLLPSAVEQQPQTNELSITTFPGQRDAALAALNQLGATVIGEDSSPFGPTLIVEVPPASLTAVAQMPLAQEIEVFTPRRLMNDLTRVIMGVATNTLTNTPNYLALSGKNVTVNMNDSGADAGHPDLTNRVLGNISDSDGHGTHVAGIIIGSGAASSTVTNKVPGSIIPGASFRGKATNAVLFVQPLDLTYGPYVSDAELQENASSNLGPTNLISNNSWGYASTVYDSHAASYDAATRDALPNVDGEQPLLFVFSAGNNGASGTITSPGTAKNVITVGASDSPRFITNLVIEDNVTTNEVWYDETDNSNLVAGFSSGGNVSIGVEGPYGRFKPDVVAPGVFIVSCRSHDFFDPTQQVIVTDNSYAGQSVAKHQTNYYGIYLPTDTSRVTVIISSNSLSPIPFPTNMLLLADTTYPPIDPVATNFVQSHPYNLVNFNPGDVWFFGVAELSNQLGPVNYNLDIYLYETNDLGDYFQVLGDLDNALLPSYRYESGTSMSAGAVSGTLALMQEFLQTKTSITNPSPALLKAMLINGSRSLGITYDFDVNTLGDNAQGWGLPCLTNSIPNSVTNGLGSPHASILLIDQSPTNALATGQYRTYQINCSDPNAATNYPMRITLVWTDPPGDPASGIALVNDLDLTVVDATGSNIYIGNDFLSGDIFTEVSSSNTLPPETSDNTVQDIYVANGTPTFTSAGDAINNVQNVYINPANVPMVFPLTVTISGTRVNVNAVPGQTTNIVQDYALVISSDDPALTQPLVIQSGSSGNLMPVLVTVASNGVPLLHQRVGANEPNLYTYPSSTNGDYSQWHFFIFTNNQFTNGQMATNVAFATFLPPNLSIPRQSGSADIDLYVSTNYSPLVNFPAFVQSAEASLGRTGTETVMYTNSFANEVYYIGVKSEDQQAADFGFYGIAQQAPFSTPNGDGSITATGTSLPVAIPNSISPVPALAFAFMLDPDPLEQTIRRATVTLGIQFASPGSLYGTLQHDGLNTVLNSFTSPTSEPGFTNTFDDLQEDPDSGDITSAGPGSLTQYVGQQVSGLWLLSEANDDQFLTGSINIYTVTVDPQPPLSGFFITLNGGEWFDDYVLVPNDATNLIISAIYEGSSTNGTGGPIGIYLTNVDNLNTSDYGVSNVQPPGGYLSLGTNFPVPNWPGSPALEGGTWYFGLYNQGSSPVTLYVQVQIQENLTPNLVQDYTNNAFTNLTTDAHTQSSICLTNFTNNQQVVSLQVGVRINDTNLDDLVLHLTSPQGTSVLLFEDRGGTNATSLGLTTNGAEVYTVFTEDTNLTTTPIKFAVPPYAQEVDVPPALLWSNSWETVPAGVYTNNNSNGIRLEGWLVTNDVVTVQTEDGTNLLTNNEVGIVTDPTGEQVVTVTNVPVTNTLVTNSLGSNYLALTSGRIIQTFGATNYPLSITNGFNITNGLEYELVYYAKPLGIVSWWPGDNNTDDIINTNNGTITNTTFVDGEVGRAFDFDGTSSSYMTCPASPSLNVGTNNGITMELWINPSDIVTVQRPLIEYDIGSNLAGWGSHFWINGSETNGVVGQGALYADFIDTADNIHFFASSNNVISSNVFQHVAATYDKGTGIGTMYCNGAIVAHTNLGIFTPQTSYPLYFDRRLGYNPAAATLLEDEIGLYDRALSPAEVYAIYHAGTLGKYSTNSLLPNFNLTIDGISTNNIILTNASEGWQLFTNTFVANSNQVTIEFQGNALGVLLDDIQLVQVAATNYNNYYLPEEPLTPFVGEDPLGCWTLDVWDTRNDSPNPVNGELLSWSLEVTTSSTNAVLNVLTNDMGVTNTITNGTIAYYAIDVPAYATFATNTLTVLSGGPLTLFFDQTALPTGGLPGDVTLASGVAVGTPSTNVLATEGAPPPLLPGQRYFLGVETTGASATYSLEVSFNGFTNVVTALTNAYGTNNIGVTNTYGTNAVIGTNNSGTNGPQYYSFVVPTNAVMVTFQIVDPTTNGEIDLYARKGLPLPGPDSFDYESRNAGSNGQFIVITTNSVPVPIPVASTNDVLPLAPTTWYLAAYNFAQSNNIGYAITATVLTSNDFSSSIIPLTNAEPYTNSAPPGYPDDVLYSFDVTNSPAGITFTVTNLSGIGNVELLANISNYPTPQQTFFSSFNSGTNNQVIQVVPNAMLPNLDGMWYLVVPNTTNTNVSYSITAVTNVIAAPPITNLTWSGAVDSYWDILTTSNWVVTGTSTPYPYRDGSPVTFDDSATGTTTVDLRTTLAPAGVTVNATKTYTFTGSGNISSNVEPLLKSGTGTLIIDNSTPNSFTSVTFSAGTLQIGNNDANGSLASGSLLGAGPFTDGGTLAFDRSDNNTVSTTIAGSGSVSQNGSGILTLSGGSTYSGATTINSGTILVDSTNALGSWTGGAVTINNGGTLDLSGLPAIGAGNPLFGGKQFNISGAGTGGNGAIVNNGNQLLGGFENISLNTNAAIGGSARWTMLNASGANTLNLNNFTLTKTGVNQISLVSTMVTAGNIVINQGVLSFEGMPQFTGSATITANSGGLVGQNSNLLGSFTHLIDLNGGGTTNLAVGGVTYLDAPIDVTANSSLGNGAGLEIFNGIISGAFGLTNLGAGTNLLSATNAYTGVTFVEQGTLGLTNTGSITNSQTIIVAAGATLDASGRADHTLTLVSNQTLYGDGTMRGNLRLIPGAAFSPGGGPAQIGSLTVTGSAILSGTNYMEVNIQSLTSDVLTSAHVFYGGVLVVTNLDTADTFGAGDTFTLFNSPTSANAFSAIVLPPLPSGLFWTNTFGTSGPGQLIVYSTNAVQSQPPAFSQFSVAPSGGKVIFSGTNGAPGGFYSLLTTTNVSLPFTNWTVITTGIYDSQGDFTITNAPTNNPQFYILRTP